MAPEAVQGVLKYDDAGGFFCEMLGRKDGANEEMVGAGSSRAWARIYLPGAGWIEFDPTNGLVGGANLIRVGVARDPSQAIPVRGAYTGAAEDFIDLTVEVRVTAD